MKVKIIVILIVFFIFGIPQFGYAWGRRWRPVPPAPPVAPTTPSGPSGSSGKAPLPSSLIIVTVISGVLLLKLWKRKRNENSD